MFLSNSDFAKVISFTPLISIDLCILKKRKILLGKRINPPAKNFFFVPGGRILKSELKQEAFDIILKQELNLSLKANHLKFVEDLGIFEHFYEDNFLGNKDFSTHYLVISFLIPYESLKKSKLDHKSTQHSEYIWLDIDNINEFNYPIHPNIFEYLINPKLKNFAK